MCNQTLRIEGADMEYGSIARTIQIDASPEVVFEVISSPEHVREWWSDEAALDPAAGGVGELVFGDRSTEHAQVVSLTVVEAEPPRLFSFRWVYPDGEAATSTNSLLVRFELVPSGAGTELRFTETGFREIGWEAAVLEQQYKEHSAGWDTFLPRLRDYADQVVSSR
jgi:uncharacterized protein YndB with AHSA1/START domain